MLPANYNPSLKIFGLPLHGLLSDQPGYRYPGAMSLSPFVFDQNDNLVALTAPGIARSTAQGLLEGIQAPRRVLQGEVDPMTGAMLTAGAAPVGSLLVPAPAGAVGMNVFHGTPHKFAPEPGFPQGRPRMDKMGTGEGAQAYGPGFYSAEQRGVAEEYKKALSRGQPQVSYKGKLLSEDYGIDFFEQGFTYEDKLAQQIASNRSSAAQREEYRQALIDQAKRKQSQINPDDGDIEKRIYDSYQNEIDALGKINVDDIATLTPGNLYKLDIPDADAAKLLDYDAPISQQPKVVRDAIDRLGFMPDNPDKMAGGDVWYRMRQQLGEDEAAAAMRGAGVPGLRYKDAGSRGTDSGDGTRNFVVWDQDVLDRTQVLQRNDERLYSNAKPAAAAGGLLNAAAQRQADMPGGSPASPGGLMDVLNARAAEMDLPAKKRVQPRADQPGVIETTPEAYERQPIKFDQDLASLAPRRPDDKPYPKGDRVRPLIDRRDEIAAKLAERAQGQLGTNTQFFYHTGPIYEAAIKAGLSPDEARAWLRDFSQAYAATSPRTETAQNLRNATLAMAKREADIPFRDVIGSGTGGISEKGYPMMTGEGGIHGLLLDAVEGPGINRATNPKPATFAGNVEGNLSGVTADTHAIRGALDALNEIEPGSIPEQWIKPKFREQYKKDPSSLDPATMIDDTLASAKIDGKDMQVEYGPVADVYVRMAEMMGVSPAEAQSMGWFGSGARTGLASESKTIAELVNDRIDVTAQLLDITPEEAARKLFRREIPLAMNPASAAIPGLLIGNPAITQQQMQSLLADPYGA